MKMTLIKKIFLPLFFLVLVSNGCRNPLRQLERKTILKRMWSLTSLSATYTENGVANAPQQTQIFWRAEPPTVLARTVSKGTAEGSVMHYAAGTLSTYFPQSAFAIRYRNVPEISAAEQRRWLEHEYDWHVAHYDINQTKDSAVAGYATVGVRYTPNAEFSRSRFSFEWQAAVHPDYAFALETSMHRDGVEKYRIRFDKAEFQAALGEKDLAFRFPAGTTVGEYDLAAKSLTLAAAAAQANFGFRLPENGAGFTLKKIIRAQGLIPAFTAYYEDLPYQTFYTQIKDYGLKLVPERGVMVQGKRSYRVNFAGSYRSVWFLEKGVYHTVVSSRPLSDLLEWLDR